MLACETLRETFGLRGYELPSVLRVRDCIYFPTILLLISNLENLFFV
jgi:hypothetical protein